MLLLYVFACFRAPALPPEVPEGAARVAVQAGDVSVDGEGVVSLTELGRSPLDDSAPALKERLAGRPSWVDLPADTPWYLARQVVGSARERGKPGPWLSVEGGPTWEVHDLRGYRLGLPSGSQVALLDERFVLTLNVQSGPDGTWLIGSVRFLPVVDWAGERALVDALRPEQVAQSSCQELWSEPALVRACQETGDAPGRVRIGGSTGCLVSIVKAPEQLAAWPAELGAALKELALQPQDAVVLIPDARVHLAAVSAVVQGVRLAGLPAPALALPLVEGNDGPPVCNAPVRTAAALREAAARRAGQLIRSRNEQERQHD